MKTLAITASLVAALSAPAFANDTLAASVGVEAGQYSLAELIQLRDALEGDDRAAAAFILNGGANPVDGSVAYDARLRQAEEDGDFAIASYLRNSGSEVISTQSFGVNETAARIFAELAAADDS
ncbi:hypothetical protein [Nioella ostreopsis]|uniref:hypothetical protein n=1 Tax=Nioella ostreopsis TaxID=2448479 RepID=UPI000FDA0258|nr:hypothetical protein [Nioella ostreopsis]